MTRSAFGRLGEEAHRQLLGHRLKTGRLGQKAAVTVLALAGSDAGVGNQDARESVATLNFDGRIVRLSPVMDAVR